MTHTAKISAALLKSEDRQKVLPAGAVQLRGYLDRYIRTSINAWSKGVVPYKALAEFFRSGRPWVKSDGQAAELFATGEMWGKAVRSAALFYRYTADPQLKTLLRETVADLLSTKRDNGTISCSPVERQPDGPGGDLWERKYVLLALDEYYACVEAADNVLEAMIQLADATIDQVGPPPKQRIVDLGWSYALVGGNHIESSTILEPILRLYKRTGFARYLEFARYIVEDEGGARHHRIFDQVLSGMDLVEVGGVYPKAYEMLSLFEGLTEYYRATGDQRWRAAVHQFFRKIIEREITLIGNGGGDQPYHPNVRGEAWDNTAFEQTNPDIQRMMETCTGITWLKFCHQYLRLTGDAAAADYIELYAYNGLIGAMKPEGDGFSYVNLLNGIKTDKEGWGTVVDGVYVTCCNLNGPEGLAYLPLVAVMSDDKGPIVNLFEAGSMTVPLTDGGTVRLDIVTCYPVDGSVRIGVDLEEPRTFSLRIRVPAWSAATTVSVNHVPVNVVVGTYLAVERTWEPGDCIHMSLDMRCRLIKSSRGINSLSGDFQAVMRGPVVLARDENIDPDFAQPVVIIAKSGFVKAEQLVTAGAANVKMRVRTSGGPIVMVDYASVNSWSGKQVQTWLPIARDAEA